MALQLKEPETSTPLADYVYQKLGQGAPSRRSMIKYGLAGLLIGGGILSENIRHAYGSHGSPTDILDDAISSESASLEQFVELENIAEASVIAPVAGRVKIFRSSADDLLKGKNPDDSIFIIEPSAFGAFLNVAQNWTEPQTYITSSTTEPNAFIIQDDDSGFDTLIFGSAGFITIRHTDLDASSSNRINTVVASNELITALEIKRTNPGGFTGHTILAIGPNTPDSDTPESFIALLGAFDPDTSTNLEYLKIGATNPAIASDREFTIGPQIDGSGVLRPFIIVMGSDEMIEFRSSLTMDFKSRNCINVGDSGNDFGSTNNLVSTTYSGDIIMSSADIDMVTNSLVSGANSIITFGATTMNFNSRAVSNLFLGNALNANQQDIVKANLITFTNAEDSRLLTGAKQLLVQTHDAGTSLRTRMIFLGNGAVGTVGIIMNEYLRAQAVSAPTPSGNEALFYGLDVAGTTEAFAEDEAGNAVQLTSHNFQGYTIDPNHPYPWSYYAKNEFLGVELWADIAGMLKAFEQMTGKKFLYTRTFAKRSWGEYQNQTKEQVEEQKRDESEQPHIQQELKIPIEVSKLEAVEQETIEKRELLTTPIYDDDGNVIGEEPIMIEFS